MTAMRRQVNELDLRLEWNRVELRARGELDVSSAATLDALLHSVDVLHLDLWCDLASVTFIDTGALRPLMHAAYRRAAAGTALRIGSRSRAVQRLMTLHGLGSGDVLDLTSWGPAG